MHTINTALKDHALQAFQVDAAFEKWWPDLDSQLQAISVMQLSATPTHQDHELLEEILETVRAYKKTRT